MNTTAAWRVLSANRTEANYQAWRDQRDWTARIGVMKALNPGCGVVLSVLSPTGAQKFFEL